MRKKTRAKIGLIALVILGGELIALLVLLLAEPVSAAFSPGNSTGSNNAPEGAGTTYQSTPSSPGGSRDRSPATRSANFAQSHEYLLVCYAVPTICGTGATDGWPNQYAQNFSSPGGGRSFQNNSGNNGQGRNGNGFSFGPSGNPSGGPDGSSPPRSEEPAGDGNGTQPDGNENDGDTPTEPFAPDPADDNNSLLPNDFDNPPPTDSPETDLIDSLPEKDISDNDPPAPDFVDPGGPENPPAIPTPSETVAVPEPMTLTLFGSGLAALVAMRRRRKATR